MSPPLSRRRVPTDVERARCRVDDFVYYIICVYKVPAKTRSFSFVTRAHSIPSQPRMVSVSVFCRFLFFSFPMHPQPTYIHTLRPLPHTHMHTHRSVSSHSPRSVSSGFFPPSEFAGFDNTLIIVHNIIVIYRSPVRKQF